MAPKGPGGRPQNAWTNSRRRKLARLYALTDLTNSEIEKVLKSDGFNTSSRDIQNKLRFLFPKDYTKAYRAYRPKNKEQMKRRSEILQSIKTHRVSKSRRYQLERNRLSLNTPQQNSSALGKFEGPASAFRDYSDSKIPCVSLRDWNSSDSQAVNPSWLMLDGSELASQTRQQTGENCRIPIIQNCTLCQNQHADYASVGGPLQSFSCGHSFHEGCLFQYHISNGSSPDTHMCITCKVVSPLQMTFSTVVLNGSVTSMVMDEINKSIEKSSRLTSSSLELVALALSPQIAQLQPRNSTQSIARFSRQLSTRSQSCVRHVSSVWRASLSESFRSSISIRSITSLRSSWRSVNSTRSKLSEAEAANKLAQSFSKMEQDLWTELVDETRLLPTSPPRPIFGHSGDLSLTHRSCCLLFDRSGSEACCGYCGFAPIHAWTRKGTRLDGYPLTGIIKNINQSDSFGNTPLHYAAASGNATLASILSMIERGADFKAKNTSGETFMHVLDFRNFDLGYGGKMPEYVSLLRGLKNLGFPFWARDVHGRTVAHSALLDWDIFFLKLGLLQSTPASHLDALQLMGTNLKALDNYGDRPGDRRAWTKYGLHVLHNITEEMGFSGRTVTQSLCSDPPTGFASFRDTICSASWNPNRWVENFNKDEFASWVDANGDTPLTAVLKKWRNEEQELELKDTVLQLISRGVAVDMRDRRGYTALAIAAIRGSRPSVQVLLDAGAQPNSRNYQGVGIKSQAMERMHRAELEGKDKCYARILSCITLLDDYGARLEPTERDEWLLPSARNADISIGDIKNPSPTEYRELRFE